MPDKFIDIRKVFREKNPKFYKFMPSFFIEFIRKLVHEDDINKFIAEHGHKQGLEFVDAIIDHFQVQIRSSGIENIPSDERIIIAANHPLGGLDAMALLKVISAVRTDMVFIVNDILLQLKNLNTLFAGVNKLGTTARQSLKAIDGLYASDKCILIFPAGLVSRKQNGVIKDLAWNKSFVTLARKHERNIIPVHIEGANTNRFYNLANWRKRLGIKANIEMMLLPDEMYRQYHKTINITIGSPIGWQQFGHGISDQEWAGRIYQQVYELSAFKKDI
ncbi:MAG: 1-acyl-sn-glycerol-3-phosphate acyltransferase [Bacteroidia bacterium]|nr:1-acyl-sn-glycerol-3-phosphate acyltransferase [Bacteroidia bacterium]